MESKLLNILPEYDKIDIRICKTWKQIKTLVKYVKQTGDCCFDFETNGKPIEDDSFIPTIVGISFQPGARYVIPLAHFDSPFKNEWLDVLFYLNDELFLNPKVSKYAHNLKFEHRILMHFGCDILGKCFDTMLAKHLLDENTRNGLKDIVARLFPGYENYDNELGLIKKSVGGDWAAIPLKPLAVYCALDADLTLRLHNLIERRLLNLPKLYALYRNLIMMNSRVLAETETHGIHVDKDYLVGIEKDTAIKIEENLKSIHSHPRIVKFEKWRKKNHIKKLIKKVEKEVEDIEENEDLSDKKVKNKLNHRLEKISRYIAGNLVNKSEQFKEFNLNSVQQVVEFLYTSPKGLKLPIVKYTQDKVTKQPTNNPSTDEETILELLALGKDKSGFLKKLLDHRETSKLHSTYMVGMLEKLQKRTKKIHGRFLIHGTVTGRLSSREPNFQNIPRDTTSSLIKRMFIPPKGYLIVELDYSQAELRYLAEVAKNKEMLNLFKRGYNIHLATGLKINGVDIKHYDEANEIRKNPDHKDFKYWTGIHKSGKVMNFSIVYQQGDYKTSLDLSQNLGREVNMDEAAEYKQEWYSQFPGIKRFLEKHVDTVYELGYAENIFGRRRRLADIKLRTRTSDHKLRGKYNKATRDAINAPIQGGSSDYTQAASVEVWEKRRLGIDPFIRTPYMFATVHDSLEYYCKAKDIHTTIPVLMQTLVSPVLKQYYGFEFKKVEMKVSAEVGGNWGEKAEYDPNKDYAKLMKEHENRRINTK